MVFVDANQLQVDPQAHPDSHKLYRVAYSEPAAVCHPPIKIIIIYNKMKALIYI